MSRPFPWWVIVVACFGTLLWRFFARQDARIEREYPKMQAARAESVDFYHWLRHTVYDSTARQGGPLDCHGKRLVPGNLAVHPAGPLRQGDWVNLDGRWREACDVTADWVDPLTLDEFVPGCATARHRWRAEWRWVLARREQ